jgi:uncharacterized protein
MKKLQTYFFWPTVVALIGIGLTGFISGLEALFLVIILSILEVTLSFDNAVVNAKVLKNMAPLWQKRFLTWGMLVAVLGTRLVLPILIVSLVAFTNPWTILNLALFDIKTYANLLDSAHYSIGAFGGLFLLMVSLKYFFDSTKEIHWLHGIEKRLASWGVIQAVEVFVALIVLLGVSYATGTHQATVLIAGIAGVLTFIAMESLTTLLDHGSELGVKSGLSLFLYLNVLDAAFSLDGVIGAFALSSNLLVIMVGLGIGAYFVRAMTMYMVEYDTLSELRYLEHGAHWAIAGLALCMLVSLIVHVPEVVTGLIGLVFVGASIWASKKSII